MILFDRSCDKLCNKSHYDVMKSVLSQVEAAKSGSKAAVACRRYAPGVYSRGLYSRVAYMQHSPPKREAFIRDRLIFKGGFYTRLYGSSHVTAKM